MAKFKKSKVAGKNQKIQKGDKGDKKVKQAKGFGLKSVPSKSQVYGLIGDSLENTFGDKLGVNANKVVKSVFETFNGIMVESLNKNHKFNMHDLGIIVNVKIKPAQKGGVTKVSPFTGEKYKTKAKPKSAALKGRFAKKLKDVVKV